MGEFIGAQLQLDCGPLLGTFVGTVVDVSNEKVTLRDASRNGLPSDTSEVTLHRSSIVSIVMLQSKDALAAAATTSASTETAKQQPKKQQLTATSASATSAAAIAKQQRTAEKLMSIPNATPAYICSSPPVKAPSHFSGSNKKKQQQPKDSPMQQQQQQRGVTPTRKTPIGEQQYRQQNASAQKQQPRHNAFSMSAGDMMDDFDFEGNLALFDKQAFYAMVDSGQTPEPDLVRTAQPPQPEPKLRPDQSVLLP
uniref:DFDF domain-containing protein n=1 Tax=Macrostomum lignano TaxID=282301 RepID=A0A1I8GQ56_9PLAT